MAVFTAVACTHDDPAAANHGAGPMPMDIRTHPARTAMPAA